MSDSKFSSPSFVQQSIRQSTLTAYGINPFCQFLVERFGKDEALRLCTLYHIGTAKLWGGSSIFWLVDKDGNVRSGKVMALDSVTGKLSGVNVQKMCWAHDLLRLPEFNFQSCLFGEHLLSSMPDTQVMLVEDEPTSVISSHFMPQYAWLAVGGIGECDADIFQSLHSREVIIMPRLGREEFWKGKLPTLKSICKRVVMSDVLDRSATIEQRTSGFDIADFLLLEETRQQILQRMIRRNPALQLLIDKFDLELAEGP